MKKLLSILLALVMASSLSVAAVAAETEVLSDSDFPQQVNASGKWTSKSVSGKKSARYRIYGYVYESEAKEVFRLTNAERKAQGLPALTWEEDLYSAAVQRAFEQYVLQSHTRPDGSAWHTVHKLANGENLAGGPIFDADTVVQGWMASDMGHREAILDTDFNSMAAACVETNIGVFWVQLFHSDKKVKPGDPDAKTTSASESESKPAATASTSGGKTVSAKDVAAKLASATKATVKNYEIITPAAMKEIASAASGKTVSVVFATTYSGKTSTQGQLAVNPASFAAMKDDLKLGVYVEGKDVEKVAANFDKWYKNDVAVIQMAQNGTLPAAVRVTAKPAALKGLDNDKLVFYSYNAETKKVKLLENTSYKVDSKGFVSFDTTRGGYIIIADSKLEK